jgi:hypothetical protein
MSEKMAGMPKSRRFTQFQCPKLSETLSRARIARIAMETHPERKVQ